MLLHKFDIRKGFFSNIVLATTRQEIADKITMILRKQFECFQSDTVIFKSPKYPIFEDEDDPICRSLLAAGIGNDYFIGGQGKYGPAAALKTISAIEDVNNVDERRKLIAKDIIDFKSGNTFNIKCSKTLFAFAKAQIFEPANAINNDRCYFHNPPSSLPYYLADFAP